MNTYTYDDCGVCGGKVEPRRVQKVCSWGGKIVAIVKEVPAGVCTQCGERYYQADVLKHLEKQLAELNPKTKRVEVPEARYAA
jgi:YgiT-type zinc finger domain-containing protein